MWLLPAAAQSRPDSRESVDQPRMNIKVCLHFAADTVQPAGQNILNIHIKNKLIEYGFVEFCNRSNFCYPLGSYATKCKYK